MTSDVSRKSYYYWNIALFFLLFFVLILASSPKSLSLGGGSYPTVNFILNHQTVYDLMLTWHQWSHYRAHNKLFNLDTVATTSLGTDGILIRCYSPIYAVLDHLLTFLKHILEQLDHPSLTFLHSGKRIINIRCSFWWDDICRSWWQTLSTLSFNDPPSSLSSSCSFLFPASVPLTSHFSLKIAVHASPEISVLLSCSHFHTGNQHGGQLHS